MTNIDIFRNEPNLVAYSAGEVIFRDGDAGSEMFAIVEGHVDIHKADARVATLGPSEVFGEMALIDGERRSATAVANSDCRLAAISEPRFSKLVQETPYFALQLLRVLAGRLRSHLES
jgi:CRP/FNR family transcriptional regulator, cyclic AMP receptor protein